MERSDLGTMIKLSLNSEKKKSGERKVFSNNIGGMDRHKKSVIGMFFIIIVLARRRNESYARPTWPRTSTFEKATVGVGGAPNPMNDRVRPLEWKVDTRGVDKLGKGTGPATFDISVIVEGVRVVSVGDGGKTNNV